MVKKIAMITTGLTVFLLCSCVGADVPDEGTEGIVANSANYEEPGETADYEEIYETVNEITNEMTTTTPAAISVYQESSSLHDEQSVVDPLCIFWCGPVH
jgi:hypothetical protein